VNGSDESALGDAVTGNPPGAASDEPPDLSSVAGRLRYLLAVHVNPLNPRRKFTQRTVAQLLQQGRRLNGEPMPTDCAPLSEAAINLIVSGSTKDPGNSRLRTLEIFFSCPGFLRGGMNVDAEAESEAVVVVLTRMVRELDPARRRELEEYSAMLLRQQREGSLPPSTIYTGGHAAKEGDG
jgi:hypothetical protein